MGQGAFRRCRRCERAVHVVLCCTPFRYVVPHFAPHGRADSRSRFRDSFGSLIAPIVILVLIRRTSSARHGVTRATQTRTSGHRSGLGGISGHSGIATVGAVTAGWCRRGAPLRQGPRAPDDRPRRHHHRLIDWTASERGCLGCQAGSGLALCRWTSPRKTPPYQSGGNPSGLPSESSNMSGRSRGVAALPTGASCHMINSPSTDAYTEQRVG